MKQKNRTTQYLTVSLGILCIVCVCIFSFMALFMKQSSQDTISEVGNIYMAGMNERIAMHFSTSIEYRMTHVQSIIDSIRPEAVQDEQEMRTRFAYDAESRGFHDLVMISESGEIDVLYGDGLEISDPEPFLASLRNGERKAAVGECPNNRSENDRLLLLGIPVAYPMANGGTSIALVASMPVDALKNILALDSQENLVYSHVIRRDGSFVIRSGEAFRESYFERLHAELGQEAGEQQVSNIRATIEQRKDYSAVVYLGKERRHLYCSSLPYTEWYLVTVMPFGVLDQALNHFSHDWTMVTFFSCGTILVLLLLVFIGYLRQTRQYILALQQARHEAEHANKAKSEFLSSMSHDIRTPMNAIIGMTTLAIGNAHNPAQVQDYLRKIELSSKHLLGLINDVLDISKIESGKMALNIEPVSLREAMDCIVNIVQPQVKGKNQRFNAAAYEILSERVYCDSVRLNQVLINLLGNAVKFTPENGSVQVTVYQEALPETPSRVRTHFVVSDTGIGMSKEYQKVIFESFSREDNTRVQKTEGSGLGMTITKYIVDAMGGTISVRSEQGQGSEFHVVLDLEKAAEREKGAALPDWRVLVVDSDERLCVNTSRALASIGIRSAYCRSGEEAMERLADDRYQVILLGWELSDMNGIEAARALCSRYGEERPPALLMACDWSGVADAAREAGIAGFISKPLFQSTLFDALSAFAGTGGEESSGAEKVVDIVLRGKRILLAEDNELNWEVAREMLSVLELDLDWVENGQMCVTKFEQSPVGYYDAILMDVRMPEMDGYEATAAIRGLARADAGLPIIAMTADAFSEDMQKCLECGMHDHLAKPIDVQAVAYKLKKYLK